LSLSIKKIRTAQHRSCSLLDPQNGQNIHFFPTIKPEYRQNRPTLCAGGFSEFDAPTGIRTSTVVLKRLCPDPLINNHNPDLLEII